MGVIYPVREAASEAPLEAEVEAVALEVPSSEAAASGVEIEAVASSHRLNRFVRECFP
jgi:hypothetical protein